MNEKIIEYFKEQSLEELKICLNNCNKVLECYSNMVSNDLLKSLQDNTKILKKIIEEKEEEENKSIIVNDYKLSNGYEDLCNYVYDTRYSNLYDYE